MKMINPDKFNTGLKWMDLQHTELVNMTIELLDSIEKGKPERNTAGLLEFLDRYVLKHFSIEKGNMKAYNYPDTDSHLAEHSGFVYALSGLKAEFHSSGSSSYLSGKVKRHLLDWLVNHIGGSDKKFVQFLLSKGVSPDAPALKTVPGVPSSKDRDKNVEEKYC